MKKQLDKKLDKIYAYIPEDDIVGTASTKRGVPHRYVDIEYIRKDAFINKVTNYLSYMLYDRVEIKKPGKIIPSSFAKSKFIEDFKKYLEG